MFKGRDVGAGQDVDIDTLIGPGTVVEGDVTFQGGLHVEGAIKGSVVALEDNDAVLTISQSATISGQVRVPIVIVDGTLEGDIVSSVRVELSPNARISGNVHYRAIQMALGAQVSGRLVFDENPPLKLAGPETDTHQEKQ